MNRYVLLNHNEKEIADYLIKAQHERTIRAVEQAIDHLRAARDLLRQANAPRTLAKVRLALSSAKGAKRNAEGRPYRSKRRAP